MTDPKVPDQQVVDDFRQGDERAFEQLYRYCHSFNYSLACSFVKPEIAKEITAETFLKLWRLREQFDNLPSIKAFLRVVIQNDCLDYIKSLHGKSERNTVGLDTAGEMIALDNDERAEIKASMLQAVKEAFEKLTPQEKAIITDSFYEGLSNQEIVDKLGITDASVRNLKSRAVKNLKKLLAVNNARLGILLYCLFFQK